MYDLRLRFDDFESRPALRRPMHLRNRDGGRATLTAVFVCFALTTGVALHAQSDHSSACTNSNFNAQTWVEDFAQLTNEMSVHYSDLEYAIHERHMDLPRLRRETELRLRTSCDEHEARLVLQSFLNSFGDGHLEIDWEQPTAPPQDAKKSEALPCADDSDTELRHSNLESTSHC